MKKNTQGLKVIIFGILCLVGLFYLTMSTGKLHVGDQGYDIYVVFDDIAGLANNAPVMLNGFEVGRVQDIKVAYEQENSKTVLKLLVHKDIQIWNDPVVSIKTLGLMGEKFIQISSLKGKGFLKPGAVIQGMPYMDLDVLVVQAKGLTEELKKLTGNLNRSVEDNQDSITRIVQNLESTSKNLEEFSADLKSHPWKLLYKGKEK